MASQQFLQDRWDDSIAGTLDEPVKASFVKYEIGFDESETGDELRDKLASLCAGRALTHVPVDPKDCALFLAGPKTPVTTGQLIPAGGDLVEAYLR